MGGDVGCKKDFTGFIVSIGVIVFTGVCLHKAQVFILSFLSTFSKVLGGGVFDSDSICTEGTSAHLVNVARTGYFQLDVQEFDHNWQHYCC